MIARDEGTNHVCLKRPHEFSQALLSVVLAAIAERSAYLCAEEGLHKGLWVHRLIRWRCQRLHSTGNVRTLPASLLSREDGVLQDQTRLEYFQGSSACML